MEISSTKTSLSSIPSFEPSNLFFMSPVKTALAEMGTGVVTEEQIDYYTRRARGGVGTIIFEPIAVLANGKEHPKQVMLDGEANQRMLGKLIERVHEYKTKLVVHLNHAGRGANPKVTGEQPLSAGDVFCPTTGQTARAMGSAEVEELIEAFVTQAGLAQKAGADAVEVQMGHGYIVNQFLSSTLNKRSDAYGQDRFLLAQTLLQRLKEALDIPLFVRVSGYEFSENGLSEQDSGALLDLLEGYGVSLVHVGWGNVCDSPPWYYNHMSLPLEVMDQRLGEIRERTNLPLIAAGRMQANDRYSNLVTKGIVDGVALGRQLLVDPDFPGKVLRGEDVIRCGGCLQGCLSNVKQGKAIGCIANPKVISEMDLPQRPAQKVAIIGGGPAGLFAGINLAEWGMEVTVFEMGEKLGGQWNLVYKSPGKGLMKNTLDDLVQVAYKKLHINTGVNITGDELLQAGYDDIVVATGARPAVPDIPGLKDYITGFEIFDMEEIPAKRVLVIGGGLIGMEAAELLVEQGKDVVIVELLDSVGRGMEPIAQKLMSQKLETKVDIYVNTQVSRVLDQEVFVQKEGREESLGQFDQIVVAIGTLPENELYNSLKDKSDRVHLIGDAREVAQIMEATTEGYHLAQKIYG